MSHVDAQGDPNGRKTKNKDAKLRSVYMDSFFDSSDVFCLLCLPLLIHFCTWSILFMDNIAGTYFSTFCKLIYIDSPAFLRSPVVCIRYDDNNETLKEVCAETKNALFRASKNLEDVISLKSRDLEQIAVLQGAPDVAEAGYWVLGGEFGAAVRASNRRQFEKAWALAALIGLASFSPQYEPVQFSTQNLDAWFMSLCDEIRSRSSLMVHHINSPRPPPPKSPPNDASPPRANSLPPDAIPPPPDTLPPPYAFVEEEPNILLPHAIPPPTDIPTPRYSFISEELHQVDNGNTTAWMMWSPNEEELNDRTFENRGANANWRRMWSNEHNCCFFRNLETNESSWDEPSDGIWFEAV